MQAETQAILEISFLQINFESVNVETQHVTSPIH